MSRPRAVCHLSLIACLAVGLFAGCAGTSPPGPTSASARTTASTRTGPPRRPSAPPRKAAQGKEFTRRGVEREFVSSPEFGSARGRAFEDIIPVGARITAVHVSHGSGIKGIQLSYERNGIERETPLRGSDDGRTEVFKLDRNEKIIGIDAWGKGTIDGLAIASNKRTRSFGQPRLDPSTGTPPSYARLTEQDRKRYVGIGITGRADTELRKLSLRIQVRSEG